MKKKHQNVLCILLLMNLIFSNAQTIDSVHGSPTIQTREAVEATYPQFHFKGLFQGRYTVQTVKDIDVNGSHHSDHNGIDNSFLIKYMRLQAQAQISKNVEVVMLANLADFKNDPKGGVLENAYIKYTFNPKIAFTVGQFRPWFGIEETYPIDIIQSLEWSNQYSQFGKLGWASFQIGASMTGRLKIGKLPLQYALSVVNGNGKNKINDNDNGKQYSSRIVLGLSQKYNFNFGVNGGIGQVFGKKVYAVGVDVMGKVKLNSRWEFDIQMEAKQATNHVLYYSLADEVRTANPDDYLVRGFYFLPDLRYEINYCHLTAIDLSIRYEYLDNDFRLNSNPRQTITPMIAMEFLKDYSARIQLGMNIDWYKKSIENTTQYSNSLFIIQLQGRF